MNIIKKGIQIWFIGAGCAVLVGLVHGVLTFYGII